MMKKSNLDEMQEQKLLKIESTGFWLTFSAIIAAILLQGIFGGSLKDMIGELIVLLVIIIYMVIGCIRNGIWDRRLKANQKTNFLGSLVAGLIVGVFSVLRFSAMTDNLSLVAILTCIFAIGTFLLCFLAMTVCAKLYKKRREKLDQE